jgi:hypothetical protein
LKYTWGFREQKLEPASSIVDTGLSYVVPKPISGHHRHFNAIGEDHDVIAGMLPGYAPTAYLEVIQDVDMARHVPSVTASR